MYNYTERTDVKRRGDKVFIDGRKGTTGSGSTSASLHARYTGTVPPQGKEEDLEQQKEALNSCDIGFLACRTNPLLRLP
jgi:hypothetical protein